MTVRQGASLCGVIAVGLSLLGVQTASNPVQAQSPERLLDTVGLELKGVTDSASYLLYRYRILNPASSRGGVAGVKLDLSAQLASFCHSLGIFVLAVAAHVHQITCPLVV